MSMKIFDFHAFNEELEKLGGAPSEMVFSRQRPLLDSAAVSIFVVILVELANSQYLSIQPI